MSLQGNSSTNILIVEDDAILREEIVYFLNGHGLRTLEANNSIAIDELMMTTPVDILILDVNLPGRNGFEIAQHIRGHTPGIGIIMLTARTALHDRLKSYESGADIYLPKPTAPEELLAAILSLRRRMQTSAARDTWTLDSQRRYLFTPGGTNPVSLTSMECALLHALAQATNHTLDSNNLCELIGEKHQSDALTKRALENLVSRLRKKAADASSVNDEVLIRSVWGVGYQLAQPVTITVQR